MARQILVVDDDPTLRETLGEVLTDEGYIVKTAADGYEALERLRTWSADLVIIDVMMPVMDAYAFRTEQLRRGWSGDGAMLLVSAAPNLEETARRLDAAALAKPFSIDALLDRVQALLS